MPASIWSDDTVAENTCSCRDPVEVTAAQAVHHWLVAPVVGYWESSSKPLHTCGAHV